MNRAAYRDTPAATVQEMRVTLHDDDVYQALLGLCEMRGWGIAEGVQMAFAVGLSYLQGKEELNSGGATDLDDAVQAGEISGDLLAGLRAENARLSVENAHLHAWIAEHKPNFPT